MDVHLESKIKENGKFESRARKLIGAFDLIQKNIDITQSKNFK